MSDLESKQSLTQTLLPRAVAGDAEAMDDLLRHCSERLTILTHRMLGDFKRLRRWAETDDVLQNALIRLIAAMRIVRPTSSRDFLGLASLQIRRELIDLSRHYYGPEGIGANHDSGASEDAAPADPPDLRYEPASLAQWTEVHRLIDELPADDREVIGLLFYQGLSQAEAAEVLNMSLRTVQRRWHDALCKLHRMLNDSRTS